MTTKKQPKTKKTLTLKEFQAWLAGVEELHPTGWSPTAEQWKLIRNKIRLIEEAPNTNAQPQHLDASAPLVQSEASIDIPSFRPSAAIPMSQESLKLFSGTPPQVNSDENGTYKSSFT